MEIDPDVVPWHDDLCTVKPVIKNGQMMLPTGPGWGTDVNEAMRCAASGANGLVAG